MSKLEDRLFSRLVHDLKSPLGSLRDALQLLVTEKAGSLQPLQKDLVTLCLRNSDLVLTRIAKLAEWYRLTSGLVEFTKSTVDLNSIASSALTRVKASLRGTHKWDYRAARNLAAVGDPAKLELMMVELLENAALFSQPGSRLLIELDRGAAESSRDIPAAIFRVRHPGVALLGVEQHDLLKPFYPLRLAGKSQSRGLGLGLPIAVAIASAHGGDLTWTCDREQGTTFTVWIPLRHPAEQ